MNNRFDQRLLVERLSKSLPVDQKTALAIVDGFFEIVSSEIKEAGRISLFGFGSFHAKYTDESTGRNPQTGKSIIISPHYRIKFSAAKALAARVNSEYADLKAEIVEESIGLLGKACILRLSLED